MYSIDEIAQNLDIQRKPKMFRASTQDGTITSPESDAELALRLVPVLYESHLKSHHPGWQTDREEGSQEFWALSGQWRAYVWRMPEFWSYTVYHSQNGKVALRGATKNRDLALQICSLALFDLA